MAKLSVLHSVRELLGRDRQRPVSRVGDRVYVEFRGVTEASRESFRAAVADALEPIGGVLTHAVNPLLGRVMIQVEGEVADGTLLRAINSAERSVQAHTDGPGQAHERALPDDAQVELQRMVEAIADGMGLLTGIGLSAVPLFPRALGTNVLGLLFIADNVPGLRALLEEKLGTERAELFMNLATAAAQAASQRPLASMVDLSNKFVSLRELRTRKALWERLAEGLTVGDVDREVELAPPPRPVPLPRGPIERHIGRAWWLAAAASTVSLATTRSPGRAVAALFAALPQPARMGRELFANELSRQFARRGTLVLSADALRRMDRVDCLILPTELMAGERFSVGEVFDRDGRADDEVRAQAQDLFAPEHPLKVQSGDGNSLGPLRLLSATCDDALEAAASERAARGALVLGVAKGGKVRALVEVRVVAQRGAEEVVQMARRNGMRVVLASDDISLAEGKHPHDVVPAGEGLVEAIRRLQSEGHTVAYASRGPGPGLAAADLGISLRTAGTPTAWGAHVLCADDPAELGLVVSACEAARTVSDQSVRLAVGATALGTIVSAGTKTGFASRRVMFVVNAVSLVAMFNALRRSSALTRSRTKWADPTPWHALDAQGVLTRLGTGLEGLPGSLGEARLSDGDDSSPREELWAAITQELLNPLAPLLAAGAGISAAVGSMADAGMVAGVGGINALIGGVQRYRTEKAIRELTERAETRCRVRVAGVVHERRADSLRRGDIVVLGPGDQVPADCRVIEAESLEVDASSLTGESLPVLKTTAPSFAESIADRSSMVYSGTTVAAGRASVVVVATGKDTLAEGELGIAGPAHPRGGVEQRLRQLMAMTGPVAVAAGAGLVATGLLRGRKVDDLVGTGVSLAVAAVPEGLPLLATVAQQAAAERLSRNGALVRNARAVEALGRVDVLCLDKTGTLTEGRIELDIVHDGAKAAPLGELSGDTLDVLRAGLCSVCEGQGERLDPTDEALLRAADEVGLSRHSLGSFKRIAEQAFESARGYQSVLGDLDGEQTVFVKGAPEAVVPRCSTYRPAGVNAPIVPAREELLDAVAKLARRGLRVIAIARGNTSAPDLDSKLGQRAALKDTKDLELLGLLAFRDPVRSSAQTAIDGLGKAGVRVVMLTGDHPATAQTIADEVGLLRGGRVVSGARLAQLSDTELEALLTQVSVYARVTPAQKVRIVRALQRAGHTVAMAGDGANDAPALRLSDVGIAVGDRSTPAARAASDIVLADARIDRIVDAVVEGRAMWISVRDAVSILVGGNLGEIGFTVAIGGLTGRPPLSPRQLLLVNFLTDIAPAMAIALRAPSVEHLEQLAHEGPEASLGSPLNRDIMARAFVTAAGASTAWTLGRLTGGAARARTIGLAAVVGSQLGQTLRTGGLQRPVILTSIGSAALLGLIVQTPGVSQVFGCRPLGPIGWSIAIGSATAATLGGAAMDRAADAAMEWLKSDDEEPAPRSPETVDTRTLRPAAYTFGALDPALKLLNN